MDDLEALARNSAQNDSTGVETTVSNAAADSNTGSSVCSLDHFPLVELYDHLLANVFDILRLMSRQSALALASISHRFYRVGFPIICQTLTIRTFYSRRFYTEVEASNLPAFIRDLCIGAEFWDDQEPEYYAIEKLVSLLYNLRSLTWKGCYRVPPGILRLLEKAPSQPKLIVDPHPIKEGHEDYDLWDEGPLQRLDGFSSSRLTTLVLYSQYMDEETKSKYGQCISKIIKSCPNLRSIRGFQSRLIGERPTVHISLHPGEQLPRIEEIAYMATTVCENEAVEWTALKKLTVESIDDLAAYQGRVPSLESLTIRTSRQNLTSHQDWGLGLGPLRKIALIGQSSTDLPIEFLRSHGSTLEELVVHSDEPRAVARNAIDPKQVKAVVMCCPKIHTLSIDLNPTWVWHGVWPIKFLRKIAQFPALKNLTFIASRHDSPRKPKSMVLDESSVCELFQMLGCIREGRPLRSVRIEYTEYTEFQWDRSTNEWEVKAETIYTGILRANGQIYTTTAEKHQIPDDHSEQNLKNKNSKGLYSSLYEREVAEYPLKRYTKREELIWLAQRFGHEWALTELVSEGLMTNDELNMSVVDNIAYDAKVVFQQHRKGELDGRATLKKELKARKWAEKYGRNAFLYDILYPASHSL